MPPFATVVAVHGGTVLRVCRAILGASDADDAWSETFLAALRAYPALPGEANIEAWLVTIAKRKAIDHYRARQRRPQLMADLPERGSQADNPATADDALPAALLALTPRQRDAVVLHHLAGLPYAEVAAAIGGSEAAARRAAADGIARLRRNYHSVEASP